MNMTNMNSLITRILTLVVLVASSAISPAHGEQAQQRQQQPYQYSLQNSRHLQKKKPFRRALVISGGGVTPGVGTGIIAGVESLGWKPDIVITTCGASVAAAVRHAFPTSDEGLAFSRSRGLYDLLSQVQLETSSLLDIKKKFDLSEKNWDLPDYFTGNVLLVPQEFQATLPNTRFRVPTSGSPRIIMVAARAKFGPVDVGTPLRPSFTEVYFTDPDTAAQLRGFDSPIHRAFQESWIDEKTETLTSVTTLKALRASIADPYLLAPGEIDGQYYMTGAINLYPIETAFALADEVVATYPSGLFQDYEDFAINRTFGFSQRQRALQTIQRTDVKWIDIAGMEDVTFDPKPTVLGMKSRIPSDFDSFLDGINDQIEFGYNRAREALSVQKDRVDVRTHLRKPISKALYQSFTCENAYEWKTSENRYCLKDWWGGCNRKTAKVCTPVR